jgi:hypothetical protein
MTLSVYKTMHPKEQQIIEWLAVETIRREDACLDYKLKFGKYTGFTLEEMLGDSERIQYIQWLKRVSASSSGA